jgi:hypothetical protein
MGDAQFSARDWHDAERHVSGPQTNSLSEGLGRLTHVHTVEEALMTASKHVRFAEIYLEFGMSVVGAKRTPLPYVRFWPHADCPVLGCNRGKRTSAYLVRDHGAGRAIKSRRA